MHSSKALKVGRSRSQEQKYRNVPGNMCFSEAKPEKVVKASCRCPSSMPLTKRLFQTGGWDRKADKCFGNAGRCWVGKLLPSPTPSHENIFTLDFNSTKTNSRVLLTLSYKGTAELQMVTPLPPDTLIFLAKLIQL